MFLRYSEQGPVPVCTGATCRELTEGLLPVIECLLEEKASHEYDISLSF